MLYHRALSKSTHHRAVARLVVVLIVVLGVPLAGTAFYWMVTFPDVGRLARNNPSSTALMEARMAEARERGRTLKRKWVWVPLSRISPYLKRAVIVAEDASFYSHGGFDWEGIKEAAAHNLERGKLHRGGSTITQQLAKNLYLSSEKSLLRKAHEAVITRTLEHQLTKSRILELYLNVVEWGQGIYGAEAAARHHFGKSAAALNLEEAVFLAAILPAPRQHDPIRVTPSLSKRRQHILRWMGKRYLGGDGT
ncbi:MAG: monofunctional biosynthetic peptidoglycan transglycosylase [Nitrospiraceae bacterium]|nr:monofunctional biosynthetic peptidoglycan transglycosylase [Nitrospirota bacterium]